MMLLRVLLSVCAVTKIASDSCGQLGEYLTKLDQLIESDMSAGAVAAHPSESRADGELSVCSKKNSCCTKQSEEILREASREIFHTHSITMALGSLEEEIKELKDSAIANVKDVVGAADGEDTGAEAELFVRQEDADAVEKVVRLRLTNMVNTLYGAAWDNTFTCVDYLQETESLLTERVSSILTQYRDIIQGLAEGVNKVPQLKTVAIQEVSASCTAALAKSSLFDSLGCKKCSDVTASAKTCYPTCVNVARGCLRPLLCHTTWWTNWTENQDGLVARLAVIAAEREEFMGRLLELLVSEIADKSETLPEQCNINMTAINQEEYTTMFMADLNLPDVSVGKHSTQFGARLETLPDSVCQDSSFVSDIETDVDEECWNGEAVAPYPSPVLKFTLNKQKCNPEVQAVKLQCDVPDMSCPSYIKKRPPTEGKVKNDKSSAMTSSVALPLLVALLVKHLL